MDEKGVWAGCIGKQKRVFSRDSYMRKETRQSLHNGSREWITIVACTCADGTALPPSLIFQADSDVPQSTWISDIDKEKHSVYTTVSPSGWSNDDVGLGWIEQVFNPLTKEKAWRSWRLLIMDGHGSYVTPQFLSFCARERVLVLIYPPHSTQTLQPLDVVCFSPFAGNYSKALTEHLHASQGLEPFKKGDFFLLFWRAWVETFTEALILRSFEAVGIALLNPDVILRRFNKSTPEAEAATSLEVNDVDNNWRESDRVWRRSVRDPSSTEALQLRQTLHHLSNQNELLKIERENLQAALAAANQKPEKGKPLPLIQRRETQAKAQWWSPRAVNEAQHL